MTSSTRSFYPWPLPPQISYPPHPMHSLYTPRQPFPSQGNNECVHFISITWGGKTPLPHDLEFPTSYHLKYGINLTPYTLFRPPASRFHPRAITNAYTPYPSLGGQKTHFRTISSSRPLTTSHIEP